MAASQEDSTLLSPKTKSIDTILSRLGFGSYQKYIFFIVGMGQIADGIELTAIAVLTPVLKDEMDLTVWQMGLLGGVVFLGMIIGNGTSAYLGDTVGRLPLLQKCTLLMFIAAFASGLMPEYWSFLSIRFFVGLANGMMIPIASSYATEICPKETRGKFLVSLNLFFVLGTLLVILLAIIFASAVGGSSWRYVLTIAAMPALIAFVMLLFVIKESPRFLAAGRRSEEAIAVLNYIGEINGKERLNQEEERAVWQYEPLLVEKGWGKISIMLEKEYRRRTFQLMFLWVAAVFTYYGLLFILPETLNADSPSDSNLMMLVTSLIQIPATIVNILTIDHQSVGRRHTISICLLAQTLCCLAAAATLHFFGFIISMVFAMFFISIWFTALYPYTGELFHTSMRPLAYGTLNIVARAGGAVAPILLLETKELGGEYPYLLLALVSLLASLDALFLPYETRNAALDQDLTSS